MENTHVYGRETIRRPNAIVVWGSQGASLSKGLRMKIQFSSVQSLSHVQLFATP